LKTNGSLTHKQDIRRQIHGQLKKWVEQSPFGNLFTAKSLTEKVGSFGFFPIAVQERDEIAELNITVLRPELAGDIVHGGDIDNRLKTFFDCLTIPKANQIPKGDSPKVDEMPFYCLLQDDKLITNISVSVHQLLKPCSKGFVCLLVHVQIKQIEPFGRHAVII
jgi:hypothetical protein